MYNVKFSDNTKTPIEIDEILVDDSTSIELFGRKRLAYGEELQTDLVRILENFSCPEDSSNPGNPDSASAQDDLFSRVIEGQFWFNSTTNRLFYYDGTSWIRLGKSQDYAANWGVIAHGDTLPKPVGELTGLTFDYSESVWIVSPYNIPADIDFMECSADTNAVVTSQYRYSGTSTLQNGYANYLIVGISDNVPQDAPVPTTTITPTPTPTPTSGASLTPTPTVTRSATPAPSLTSSVGSSPTPTPTSTGTPPVTPTKTPAATPVPSITPTTTPAPVSLPFNSTIIYAYSVGAKVSGPTASCSVSFTFNPSGTYTCNTASSISNNSPSFGGTWLPSGWTAADSQIIFTPTVTVTDDSAATLTNTAATLTSLTSPQTFALNASVVAGNAIGHGSSAALNITIRKISTGLQIVTNCTVKVDCSSGV